MMIRSAGDWNDQQKVRIEPFSKSNQKDRTQRDGRARRASWLGVGLVNSFRGC